MLIIAMPKSASTSLVSTLSEMTGQAVLSSQVRKLVLHPAKPSPSYRQLAQGHKEFIDLDEAQASAISAVTEITKHHFPPSPINKQLLKQTRKVILLRDTDEVIESYWRGLASGTYVFKHEALLDARSLEEWRTVAEDIGLAQELDLFKTGWQQDDVGQSMQIHYRDLTAMPDVVLKQVAEYFGYHSASVPTLHRKRYSRSRPGRGRAIKATIVRNYAGAKIKVRKFRAALRGLTKRSR